MDAAATYRRRSIEGSSPVGLIVLLYQGVTVDLRRAIAAIEHGRRADDIEARTNALNRVLVLVGELRGALDFERGGEIARQFQRFFQLAERLVLQASFDHDARPLRELLQQFAAIRDAWQQVDTAPAMGAPVASPYAAAPQPSLREVRPAWQA